ncbi:hypothetical protein C9426_31650, partial [Serratia sp. S1B]
TVGGAPFAVNAASVVLTADSSNLSTAKSQLSASPASIVADGNSASTLRLDLKDANDNPVSGQTVVFISSLVNSHVGSIVDHLDGTYTALLTSTEAGTATITVTVGGAPLAVNAASVVLTADSSNLSTAKSQLSASPASIVADGNSASTLSLTLKDANGNLVSGQTVSFVTSLGTLGAVTETSSGVYSATLTAGTLTGLANVTARVNSTALSGISSSVTLTPVPVDITMSPDSSRKNIGDTIQLTVLAKAKGTSNPAPNVKITFAKVAVVNRQNSTVSNSGVLQINGAAYNTFTGMTDANGQLVVSVTDPNGIGVQTTLQAKAESNDTQQTALIFNVITSPDTPKANMWGYMQDLVTVNGVTFKRPFLYAEIGKNDPSITSNLIEDEVWARFTFAAAMATCTLPTQGQLKSLANAYPPVGTLTGITASLGWPSAEVYRTLTPYYDISVNQHYYVQMLDGSSTINRNGGDDKPYNVTCVQ